MIVHIVLVKFKDKSAAKDIKAILDALPEKIDVIKKYEVGVDEMDSPRSFHLSVYSQFDSYDDLKIYNEHPDHVEALQHIREHADTVHAVDYTL